MFQEQFLTGERNMDFSQALAGFFAIQHLGDQVIKIEQLFDV